MFDPACLTQIRILTYSLSKGIPKAEIAAIFNDVVCSLLETNNLTPTKNEICNLVRKFRGKFFYEQKKRRKVFCLECLDCDRDDCSTCPEALPPLVEPFTALENKIDAAKRAEKVFDILTEHYKRKKLNTILSICYCLSQGLSQLATARKLDLNPRYVRELLKEIRDLLKSRNA